MENAFLSSSRYSKQKTIITTRKDGKEVNLLTLRTIPESKIKYLKVSSLDRLDIIAQQNYGDPSKFWHIADANTELESKNIIKKDNYTMIIGVPEQ